MNTQFENFDELLKDLDLKNYVSFVKKCFKNGIKKNEENICSQDLRNLAKCLPRVSGVWYDLHKNSWEARWSEGAKSARKYYSVQKFGFHEARKLAIKTIKTKEINYIYNSINEDFNKPLKWNLNNDFLEINQDPTINLKKKYRTTNCKIKEIKIKKDGIGNYNNTNIGKRLKNVKKNNSAFIYSIQNPNYYGKKNYDENGNTQIDINKCTIKNIEQINDQYNNKMDIFNYQNCLYIDKDNTNNTLINESVSLSSKDATLFISQNKILGKKEIKRQNIISTSNGINTNINNKNGTTLISSDILYKNEKYSENTNNLNIIVKANKQNITNDIIPYIESNKYFECPNKSISIDQERSAHTSYEKNITNYKNSKKNNQIIINSEQISSVINCNKKILTETTSKEKCNTKNRDIIKNDVFSKKKKNIFESQNEQNFDNDNNKINITKSSITENIDNCLKPNISAKEKNFINPIIDSESVKNNISALGYSGEIKKNGINCLRNNGSFICNNSLYIKKNEDFSNLQTQYDLPENKKNNFPKDNELTLINIKNEKKSVTLIPPYETNNDNIPIKKHENLCKDENINNRYNYRGKYANILKRKYNKIIDESLINEQPPMPDKNKSNINDCLNGNMYEYIDSENESNKKSDDYINFDNTSKLDKKNKGSNNFCDKKNNYNVELNLKDSIHSDTLHIFKNAINLLLNDLKYKCIPNFDKKILNIIEIIDNHTNYVNSTFNETFLITYVHLFDTCVSNNILPSQMDPKIQKIFCNALIAFHILLFNFQRPKKY
ncbi:transcription factor with AP2 domain(s), putative [Plasmodium berghei]|uniref:AP2 domain transcription factor AP2-O3 n=2 Tax=Plasmodium berghei TaxID=5821 RepID=A0A509AN72_PLABA|nr:AP2 domain transcription factor AP2-O3 [Plasmodium berghei ANKA]CXI51570.1 transcription factor with AP2 domain(s), putative [Plasmodium berghei]SCL94458.1 transcription factor with AP2 domain(s), putative [Plasmodium berghei]SCM16029.1 transcription factor with AP2 domain(s), putative [Plasmodium berghei]SCM17825.1 transcription factor with AP2 domain(s), putative [Plasmodium berghei]SCN26092.1 transcription factor with AP2 domain(s), putative [Plasmodium berghei]|eukprot:XP_034421954.1 AP2 domain transcription factor AP2-O3 [Plasmodium berghei ANKA]